MAGFTRSLEQLGLDDVQSVGGKGANLGELTRAGLPVPPAFCVTTEAYRRVIEDNDLSPTIADTLTALDYQDARALERASRRIRQAIVAAAVPPDLVADIQGQYLALTQRTGHALVSVRSSATAEDLPGMSFAGQQDTYLNVEGASAVLEHVKRCWASLWTDRAIAYRHRQGFRHEDAWLAVVVQEMFPSEISGVLFTANPVTSNAGEIFINASWGLGEAVVSGKVNPDQYIVDRKTLRIADRKLHDKLTMTVRSPDGQGSVEVEVPAERRRQQALSDAQIRELSGIALGIESHYGFPQDIEWGLAAGRFAILQSREITGADLDFRDGLEAWQRPAAREGLADERWVWSRAYSDEVQTGPSSPLFYTMLQDRMTSQKLARFRFTDSTQALAYILHPYEDVPYFRWHGARAYYNTTWEREQVRMFVPPFARDDAMLWRFPAQEREKVRRLPFNWIRYVWILLKLHVTNPRVSLLESSHHLYENLERWVQEIDGLWKQIDLESASAGEILALQARSEARNSGFRENCVMPFGVYLFLLPALLRLLLERWCSDRDRQLYSQLLAGIQSKTSEENLAVWRLSRAVKASPALMALFAEADVTKILKDLDGLEDGRAFRRDLDAFLEVYGHRGGAERDCIHHRWGHRPELVFHSIKPMLPLDEADDPAVREHRLRERMQQTRAECLKRARKRGFWLGRARAAILEWLIDINQDYIYYRDFERFHNDRHMSRPRDVYIAVARKFIARGLLQAEEDIFFLGKEEVVDVDQGRLGARDVAIRVRARRRVYERYTNKEPPKFVRGWTGWNDNELPDDGKGLRGIAASRGSVTGRARVCRKLEEISRIEKGDILVTVATDPGWTTVFSIIGGVVIETGGVVAHAVMISREYDIPCVANLQEACDRIPDGATITVDGTNGRVIIHERR